MSRKSTRSQASVERLLEERGQYESWLARLAAPGAPAVPAHVVERVKEDYRSRLDNVIRQLSRYEGELESTLSETEVRRDELVTQRTARAETLAEAELRHQVGEYDEGKFAELSAEQTAALAQLGEEIAAAERDIGRYEEILGLIAVALPETPAGRAAAVPPVPAPAEAAGPVEPPPAPAAAAASAATPPAAARMSRSQAANLAKVPTRISSLDELEFIRSVAGGEDSPVAEPPAPRVEPPPAGVATPPQPEEAPAPEPPLERIVPEVSAEATGNNRVHRKTLGEADEAAKTLCCTECGTNNLPTEWYCEKCGAELSAF